MTRVVGPKHGKSEQVVCPSTICDTIFIHSKGSRLNSKQNVILRDHGALQWLSTKHSTKLCLINMMEICMYMEYMRYRGYTYQLWAPHRVVHLWPAEKLGCKIGSQGVQPMSKWWSRKVYPMQGDISAPRLKPYNLVVVPKFPSGQGISCYACRMRKMNPKKSFLPCESWVLRTMSGIEFSPSGRGRWVGDCGRSFCP
jgi:hypothetical protein